MKGAGASPMGGADSPGRWTSMVLLSVALHVAGFGLAIALPRLLPRGAQGPPVYVVDLVGPPSTGTVAPPAGRPAPVPGKKAIAPPRPKEATIKLPERNAKKAEAKKTAAAPKKTEPARPETRPTPGTKNPAQAEETTAGEKNNQGTTGGPGSGAAGGAAGPGAGQGGGQADFYFVYLKGRIESAWQKPIYPPTETTRRILTATVRLTLSSSGRVIRLDLITSSGYEAVDQSLLRAVQDAQPFQAIPTSLGSDTLTVNLAFDLTPD